MRAISIRQPWAWLILNAGKDIENRTWPTRYRGPVLIHAAKGCTRDEYEGAKGFADFEAEFNTDLMPALKDLDRGGIVGCAEIVDCVERSASPWFVGRFGFVLRNVKPLPFRPLKGELGFFEVAG